MSLACVIYLYSFSLLYRLEGSRSDVTALEQELNTNVLQVKRLVGESEDK